MTERCYTVREFAGVLHVHPRTVYRMIRSGRLAAVRAGRSIRIPAEVVRRFLQNRRPLESRENGDD